MKLADEYVQKSQKQIKKSDSKRNYIVKLGQGVPESQNRKRGISLSKSCGKQQRKNDRKQHNNETQGSQLAKQTSNYRNINYQKPQQNDPIVSITKNHQSQPVSVFNHQKQHFVNTFTQKIIPLNHFQRSANSTRPVSINRMKSEEHFYFNRKDNQIKSPKPSEVCKIKFIPMNKPQEQVSSPRNVITRQAKVHPNQEYYLKGSNHQNRPKSRPPIHINYENKCTVQTNYNDYLRQFSNKKLYMTKQTKASENAIQLQSNPYLLSNKKLKQTEKDLFNQRQTHKNPLNSSINSRLQSQSSIFSEDKSSSYMIHSKNGNRTLWQANMTQSIISKDQNKQLKIQQSQIMKDYFKVKTEESLPF